MRLATRNAATWSTKTVGAFDGENSSRRKTKAQAKVDAQAARRNAVPFFKHPRPISASVMRLERNTAWTAFAEIVCVSLREPEPKTASVAHEDAQYESSIATTRAPPSPTNRRNP